MDVDEACARLAGLVDAESDTIRPRFRRGLAHSPEEIDAAESACGLTFPSAYRTLLGSVGSGSLYIDERGRGVDLVAVDRLRQFTARVFDGFAPDPFPALVLAVSLPRVACVGGFIAGSAGAEPLFGVFHPDDDPSTWVTEGARCLFADWVVQLVESDGAAELI